MARRYRLKRRAETQEETRRRIVEAAVELHGSVGLAGTSVTLIAQRAGVGRQTVYRHFPDEAAMIGACSGLYFERNPLPDPEEWREEREPRARLRRALEESYAYHRRTEPMLSRVLPEAGDSPLVAPYHDHWSRAADVVTTAWKLRGKRRRMLRAAIGHALTFATWSSLVRGQGLSDVEAVEVMMRLAPPA